MPAVRVIADDVWRLYWSSEQDYWHLDRDFGPLLAPFPFMWVEGRVPTRIHADGVWTHRAPIAPMSGAVIVAAAPDVVPSTFWGGPQLATPETIQRVVIQPHLATDGLRPVYLPVRFAIDVDDEGRATSDVMVEVMGKDSFNDVFARAAQGEVFNPVLFALSLMNCRNIKIEDVEPRPAPRRSRRAKMPLIRYSRIVLPRHTQHMRAALSAAGPRAPLHLVRGHFKTYSNDAPLLGKHVGTWWWGWQARGHKDKGLVIPTYEVKSEQ